MAENKAPISTMKELLEDSRDLSETILDGFALLLESDSDKVECLVSETKILVGKLYNNLTEIESL